MKLDTKNGSSHSNFLDMITLSTPSHNISISELRVTGMIEILDLKFSISGSSILKILESFGSIIKKWDTASFKNFNLIFIESISLPIKTIS